MSLAVESHSSCPKEMGLEGKEEGRETGGNLVKEEVGEEGNAVHESEGETEGKLTRHMSEASLCDEEEGEGKIDLGPQCSLKDQLEKDKDDESLRRWKEQLLGSVDLESVGGGETLFPEVKILGVSILSPGKEDMVLPIPAVPNSKGSWFSLKEGSRYRLKFTFSVSNNIVSGLKYTNTVWKTGVKVDSAKEMLGTFSPQTEPYIHEMAEETTPSGIFARGSYSARTKFVDDDGKCYLEMNYNFDIRKDWS